VALLAALALTGCQAQPAEWSELGYGGERQQKQRRQGSIRIVPQSNREVADLSPDDIVRVMRQMGFADEQILELGPDLHQALLVSGAARVLHKEQPKAYIAVNGTQVYIGSAAGGSILIYDLGYSQFVAPGGRR
jgi:hypothetical protein